MTRLVRDLAAGDVGALQALLESRPEFAERLTGYPPGPSDALSALLSVPPGFDPSRKRSIGMWDAGRLVAFADLLLGYPDPDTAYIGLLIVHGEDGGRGLGRALHDAVITRIATEGGFVRTRLGLVETVADCSAPFWIAIGYAPTGERSPYRYDHLVSTVSMWERVLD